VRIETLLKSKHWGKWSRILLFCSVEKLFRLVLTNPNHVLSSLLPDKTNQRNTTTCISGQDATTDNLSTNVTSSSVIILWYVCCIHNVSCVLTTFNKDDDGDGSVLWTTTNPDSEQSHLHRPNYGIRSWLCGYEKQALSAT